MSCGTSLAQYDVLLLGAITVLGASMGKHVRCSYGGKMMSPCLQTFVVALPASGKGVLSLVRLLAEPIHDEIRGQVDESMACYRREKAKYDTLGKERGKTETPVMPLNKMFLISGNNTGTGILQNLMDSDGTGLICESEADTISTAIGSEYGHWSDTMRKAFDHDRLSYNPPHRPRIPRGKENLSFRTSVRHPLTSETTDSHCRERALFPPSILLHAYHTSLAKPVRPQ